MSGTSDGNPHILEYPQKTIGAQELLKVGSCSRYGAMRKEGRLERMFTCMKWPQRFVVLSRGCMYVYKDEMSRSPANGWSLKGYKKCIRSQLPQMRWSFRVLPRNPEKYRTISFACATDEIRKEWMGAIKEEMIKASMIAQPEICEAVDLEDYIYLEKEVAIAAATNPPPTEDDAEEHDPSIDYDIITEDLVKLDVHKERPQVKKKPSKPTFTVQTPTVSTTTAKVRAMPHTKKKMPSPPPSPISPVSPVSPVSPAKSDVSKVSFKFDSQDREEVEQMLVERPEGTYLVRKSRNGQNEVLSVNVDGTLKEFKIYVKGNKVTIDHSDYFANVEELINYYCTNSLPKKSNKLMRAFSQIDPGYVNT